MCLIHEMNYIFVFVNFENVFIIDLLQWLSKYYWWRWPRGWLIFVGSCVNKGIILDRYKNFLLSTRMRSGFNLDLKQKSILLREEKIMRKYLLWSSLYLKEKRKISVWVSFKYEFCFFSKPDPRFVFLYICFSVSLFLGFLFFPKGYFLSFKRKIYFCDILLNLLQA